MHEAAFFVAAGRPPEPGESVMSFFRSVLASIPLLAAVSAHAAPKNFHVGAGCTYATIQAALDAERINPGTPADFIWIANNQSYTAQDIQVHDQNVFLYGGVSDCVDSSISGTTTLSGSGGAAKSVMTVSGHSLVWLGGLTITQGDNTSSGVGGGINFAGTGKLTIGSSTVTNNHAGYGGGINFNGTGGASDVAELWINYETLITNNSAGTFPLAARRPIPTHRPCRFRQRQNPARACFPCHPRQGASRAVRSAECCQRRSR
jgi:hypothetical protein